MHNIPKCLKKDTIAFKLIILDENKNPHIKHLIIRTINLQDN